MLACDLFLHCAVAGLIIISNNQEEKDAVYVGRVRLGLSGLGGLLRFRMRRSIGLIQIRMSHPSSSGSSRDSGRARARYLPTANERLDSSGHDPPILPAAMGTKR